MDRRVVHNNIASAEVVVGYVLPEVLQVVVQHRFLWPVGLRCGRPG